MALFEPLREAPKHHGRLLHRRLLDLHGLEATLERSVLLEVAFELAPGRRGNRAQLAPRERRLQQVRGVAPPLRPARADERVRLVDEEDDGLRRRLDLVDHALQASLELPSHARARLQASEVEHHHLDVPEFFGNVTGGDAEREPLDESRLSDARLADDDRVVLPATAEDVNHLPHLGLAPEDGIERAGACALGEVAGELREGAPGSGPARAWHGCRPCRGGLLGASGRELGKALPKVVRGDVLEARERTVHVRGGFDYEPDEERAGPNALLAELAHGEHQRVLNPLNEDGARESDAPSFRFVALREHAGVLDASARCQS